jgi:hypothetical protein
MISSVPALEWKSIIARQRNHRNKFKRGGARLHLGPAKGSFNVVKQSKVTNHMAPYSAFITHDPTMPCIKKTK